MAEGRSRSEWNHTAELLAMMWNTTQKRKRKPRDFHPHERQDTVGIRVGKSNWTILRDVFTSGKVR